MEKKCAVRTILAPRFSTFMLVRGILCKKFLKIGAQMCRLSVTKSMANLTFREKSRNSIFRSTFPWMLNLPCFSSVTHSASILKNFSFFDSSLKSSVQGCAFNFLCEPATITKLWELWIKFKNRWAELNKFSTFWRKNAWSVECYENHQKLNFSAYSIIKRIEIRSTLASEFVGLVQFFFQFQFFKCSRKQFNCHG